MLKLVIDPAALAFGAGDSYSQELTREVLAVTVLPIPDMCATVGDAMRWENEDLPALSDRDLWRESERAKLAAVLLDRPSPWVEERLLACAAETQRRRGKP